MVTSKNAQLGKLIAAYFSTSNDTLAVSFRAHYAVRGTTTSDCGRAASPTPRIRRKNTSPRLVSATFSYRWLESAQQRIILLYQCLLRAGWIDSKTHPDHFLAIFSGMPNDCKIRWTGKKTYLVYLFRLLTDRQYISIPKGIGRWMIVSSHFVDTHNRLFAHLNSQRTPVRGQQAIDQLAELLNPSFK